jgi:cytochrome c oxidase subunit II
MLFRGKACNVRWLLDPASAQGAAMSRDWFIFIAVAIAVGAFVYANIIWCLVAYRRREGRSPETFTRNTPLELLYVSVPLAIVIGLFVVTIFIETPIDRVSAHVQSRIAVTAFRWSWSFQYLGTPITTIGTPGQPPTLYLPLGRTTEIDLRSTDVTHSFWVPAFLFKRDAIPGMENVFDIKPTRLGAFPGRCAQFCGLDHALMTFNVRVIPVAAYDRFLASRGTALP